jgi:hypothetical protein
MFHANITKVEWHPSVPELLLVRCEGEAYSSIVFVWDPLSDGPRPIQFSPHLSNTKLTGRTNISWLRTIEEPAVLFFTDHQEGILASLTDADAEEKLPPWAKQTTSNPCVINKLTPGLSTTKNEPDDDNSTDMDEGISELDDTFHFKKSPVP